MPNNVGAKQALEYLGNGKGELPAVLQPPTDLMRPTRPLAIVEPIKLEIKAPDPFANEPPFDTWLLRTEDRREYGPVPKKILDEWVSEGRVVSTMRLLRADWNKWKRVAKVYPQLAPPAARFESLDDVSLLPNPTSVPDKTNEDS